MPGVFGLEKESSGSESEEFGKTFREMKSNEKSIKGGNIEDLLSTPGLITKQLEPICEFIEDSGLCYQKLKEYCIAQLKKVFGSSITKCEYPKADVFHCSVYMDCDKGQKCDRGQCVDVPVPNCPTVTKYETQLCSYESACKSHQTQRSWEWCGFGQKIVYCKYEYWDMLHCPVNNWHRGKCMYMGHAFSCHI